METPEQTTGDQITLEAASQVFETPEAPETDEAPDTPTAGMKRKSPTGDDGPQPPKAQKTDTMIRMIQDTLRHGFGYQAGLLQFLPDFNPLEAEDIPDTVSDLEKLLTPDCSPAQRKRMALYCLVAGFRRAVALITECRDERLKDAEKSLLGMYRHMVTRIEYNETRFDTMAETFVTQNLVSREVARRARDILVNSDTMPLECMDMLHDLARELDQCFYPVQKAVREKAARLCQDMRREFRSAAYMAARTMRQSSIVKASSPGLTTIVATIRMWMNLDIVNNDVVAADGVFERAVQIREKVEAEVRAECEEYSRDVTKLKEILVEQAEARADQFVKDCTSKLIGSMGRVEASATATALFTVNEAVAHCMTDLKPRRPEPKFVKNLVDTVQKALSLHVAKRGDGYALVDTLVAYDLINMQMFKDAARPRSEERDVPLDSVAVASDGSDDEDPAQSIADAASPVSDE